MITYILIAITCAVSFICFSNRSLFEKLALIPFRVVRNHEWYRIITHGFVHADSMHLLVNMFTFWSFGVYIETLFLSMEFSEGVYLLLYFGGMVVASIGDLIKQKGNPAFISIGASGAVSSVLFTYIFFEPFGKILLFAVLPIPSLLFGVLYLIYCQYMARRAKDNINHYAHFYGAIYGFCFPLLVEPSLINLFLSHF
ncbi:rhomboid family intramembrane serine protease [Parabacteroides sp. Marseille-P3160]|uniref:rhomboid family intramembrane serine protease n=1 Tax=Parabacteroides sp. Marseille-P3160 TaxID=1917887 RepID=UPI0009BC59B5|nr:rhomboid family intramembrane serine protease [Parabacteroides sp. Marseille-P3160]